MMKTVLTCILLLLDLSHPDIQICQIRVQQMIIKNKSIVMNLQKNFVSSYYVGFLFKQKDG